MIGLHVFSYKIPYTCISTNRYTVTNETFRTKRGEGNISHEVRQCGTGSHNIVHHIEHSLLGGALGEDRGLRHVAL